MRQRTWQSARGRRRSMLDIIILAIGLGFFALSIGYACGCEPLYENGHDLGLLARGPRHRRAHDLPDLRIAAAGKVLERRTTMTVIGWIQIILYCAIVVALVKPLGAYMTHVFNGEPTFLSPVLRPVEVVLYKIGGVDERREQHWLSYTVAMLLFHVGGFLILYALLRLQAFLPFNPAGQSAVAEDLSFNTSVSFITNTNWQNYGGESTLSYLVQMLGLTHQNFLSAATGI